jgi:tetratricopeptide (TPR) repeat protein
MPQHCNTVSGRKSFTCSLALYCLASAVFAVPYIPESDDQVLETLPQTFASLNPGLRKVRTALAADPKQLGPAVKLAKEYIELGKAEADPRFYGYAQGLLQPWWQDEDPPSDVLLLRALILQNRHEFDGALRDLDKLLEHQPDQGEAWLARAVILQVQARYAEAQQSCAALINFDDTLLAATCLSQVGSLMGHGLESYRFLSESLQEAKGISPEQRQWTLTVLAEMAGRLDKNEDSDRYFIEALDVRRPTAYLLGVYADFLLDRNRYEEVVKLLAGHIRIDALLLRLALAKQQLAAGDLPELIGTLQARFAAGRLRQENLHQGDEARFALHLLKQPDKALTLAQANWRLQKEPKDARILLEAAIAANEPNAAEPVLELLRQTGMEHAQLRRLSDRLKSEKG